VENGHLTAEAMEIGVSSGTRNPTTVYNDDVLRLLDDIRRIAKYRNETRLDFDNDSSMTDNDYQNLTGLTRSEFDDLMTHVKDINQSRSRSIRSCVAILLMKLKCALDNKILATLFNMKKWQVSIYLIILPDISKLF
jgi:hypothetical protein